MLEDVLGVVVGAGLEVPDAHLVDQAPLVREARSGVGEGFLEICARGEGPSKTPWRGA